MTPIAVVEHHLPGRVRLRIRSKRGDVPWFQSVIQHLAEHEHVDEVSANPQTASILIRHSGPADPVEALATVRHLFELRRPDPTRAPAHAARGDRLSSGVALPNATAAGLTGLGIYQLSRGQALGSAVDHFWSAYIALKALRSPAAALGFAGLGLYQLMRAKPLGSAASLFSYALMAHHMSENEAKRAETPR
jgi:hypothetical protein